MKIGLLTDLHITASPDRAFGIKKSLELISKAFEEEKVDIVINLGDTFNKAYIESIQEMQVFNYYIKLFKKFKNYILIGNHEILESGNLDNSIWDVIKNLDHKNFNLIDNFTTFGCGGLISNDYSIGLLPYGCEIPSDKKVRVLFHHLDVMGMFYPSGKMIEPGRYTLNLADNLAEFYVGGHIHIEQEKENSKYLGSTFPQPFDYIENFNIKKLASFNIYDTETREYKKFYNPYPRVNLKYSETDDYQKIIYDLKSIWGVNADYKVYIRFLYTSSEYDASLMDKTIKKAFDKKDLTIEFFRKVKSGSPLCSTSEESREIVEQDPEQPNKGLEEKVLNLLREKDPELIKIYEKVK